MFKKNQVRGTRIDEKTLSSYLLKEYGTFIPTTKKVITGITPLLQKNYGGKSDCTLTSITTIGYWKKGGRPEIMYSRVETEALKWAYNPDSYGTVPFFIKKIINNVFKVKSKSAYLKDTGFNWKKIKQLIDNKQPIILNMSNDGRNYYQNHTVTVIGYMESGAKAKMLIIFDNWHETISYVDYNKMNRFCSVNYL